MVEYIFVDIVKKLSITKFNILSTIKIDMNIMKFIKNHTKNQTKDTKDHTKNKNHSKNYNKIKNPKEKISYKIKSKPLKSNHHLKILIYLYNNKNQKKIIKLPSTRKNQKSK